jgi:hypothetical protein
MGRSADREMDGVVTVEQRERIFAPYPTILIVSGIVVVVSDVAIIK